MVKSDKLIDSIKNTGTKNASRIPPFAQTLKHRRIEILDFTNHGRQRFEVGNNNR
jgi:hypothetical protein